MKAKNDNNRQHLKEILTKSPRESFKVIEEDRRWLEDKPKGKEKRENLRK